MSTSQRSDSGAVALSPRKGDGRVGASGSRDPVDDMRRSAWPEVGLSRGLSRSFRRLSRYSATAGGEAVAGALGAVSCDASSHGGSRIPRVGAVAPTCPGGWSTSSRMARAFHDRALRSGKPIGRWMPLAGGAHGAAEALELSNLRSAGSSPRMNSTWLSRNGGPALARSHARAWVTSADKSVDPTRILCERRTSKSPS